MTEPYDQGRAQEGSVVRMPLRAFLVACSIATACAGEGLIHAAVAAGGESETAFSSILVSLNLDVTSTTAQLLEHQVRGVTDLAKLSSGELRDLLKLPYGRAKALVAAAKTEARIVLSTLLDATLVARLDRAGYLFTVGPRLIDEQLTSLHGLTSEDLNAIGVSDSAIAAIMTEPIAESFWRKVGNSMDGVRTATELAWHAKGIDDSDCNGIAYLIASGALANLQVFSLGGNQIGDVGLTSFSGALASGALPQLVNLLLFGNKIGDAGLTSLSEALASGVLANLKDIYVDDKHMDHPQLKQACNRRNITIH